MPTEHKYPSEKPSAAKPRRAHRTSTGESPEHRDRPVGPIGRARSARITALVLRAPRRLDPFRSRLFFGTSPILVRSNASTDPAHPPLHWTDRRYTRHTLTHSTHTRIVTMSTPILRAPIARLRITTPLPSRSTNTPGGTAPRPPAHRNGAAGFTRRPQLVTPRAPPQRPLHPAPGVRSPRRTSPTCTSPSARWNAPPKKLKPSA